MIVADLPTAFLLRWTAYRKQQVTIAICEGLITLQQARERYWLSVEEFLEWRTCYVERGRKGLMATRRRKRKRYDVW